MCRRGFDRDFDVTAVDSGPEVLDRSINELLCEVFDIRALVPCRVLKLYDHSTRSADRGPFYVQLFCKP